MKMLRSLNWLILPIIMLTIMGCGGPIESFTFTSPEGDRTIEVSGKRDSPAGPIMVTVVLNVAKGSKPFSFEHQASSLTKENCKAEWLNNNRCNLTFTLDDNSSWEVECFLLDDKVEAIKKFKVDGKSIFH
jgi:hypothetical protein